MKENITSYDIGIHLLKFKNMLIKLLLKLFVGIIDAKLLETIIIRRTALHICRNLLI